MLKFVLLSYLLLRLSHVHAAYYDTLPQGVRVLGYRYTLTSGITGQYNQNNKIEPFGLQASFNPANLHNVSPILDFALAELYQISPELYENFTLGDFKIDARATVEANSLGFGYGISKKTSFYAQLSHYKAATDLSYTQTRDGNVVEAADDLANSNSDISNAIANLSGNFAGINGRLLQSVVVNYFKYEALGDWRGEGYGDLEMGLVHNLYNERNWGLGAVGGIVAPTGYVDDPDILQDFGFGDGQWDIFAEINGGVYYTREYLFDAYFRYTLQLPDRRDFRLPQDEKLPISEKKDSFNFDLGDVINFSTNVHWIKNSWFTMYGGQDFMYQFKSKYSSGNHEADNILGKDSQRWVDNLKVGFVFSSLKSFQAKQFLVPGTLELRLQHSIAGQNTPSNGRIELEARMFF